MSHPFTTRLFRLEDQSFCGFIGTRAQGGECQVLLLLIVEAEGPVKIHPVRYLNPAPDVQCGIPIFRYRLRDGVGVEAVTGRPVVIYKKFVPPPLAGGGEIRLKIQGAEPAEPALHAAPQGLVPFPGDDVHHTGERFASPKGGGGTFYDLDLLNIAYRDAGQIKRSSRSADNRVAVDHDQGIVRIQSLDLNPRTVIM